MVTTTAAVRVKRDDVEGALQEAGVPADRVEPVWTALAAAARREPAPADRLDGSNVLVYLGALVTILGLGYFAAIAWDSYGSGTMLAISIAYGAAFAAAGTALIARGWHTPGGLSVAAAVAMVPLIVYSFQAATGLWPDEEPGLFSEYHSLIRGGWLAMELATIAAAAVALRHVRFSFLVAPLAFSAWYASMDLAPLLFGDDVSDGARASISIAIGLAGIALSFALAELRGLRGHAFWGYLFGLAAFFGGTAFHCFDAAEGLWWLTGASGLVCLVVAVMLQRRVFAAFGGVALFAFVGYLSSEVFDDAAGLPFALSAAGIAIVVCGMVYERRRDAWRAAALASLPPGLAGTIARLGDSPD